MKKFQNLIDDAPLLQLTADKNRAHANTNDIITFTASVSTGTKQIKGQEVEFSTSGTEAVFQELNYQKIVGKTKTTGLVTVHLYSSQLEEGVLTAKLVGTDITKKLDYEFIEDPSLYLAITPITTGARADGSEMNSFEVVLKSIDGPIVGGQVNLTLDKENASFLTGNGHNNKLITDSNGSAIFYITDSNILAEDVTVTAVYNEALWLQQTVVSNFVNADRFELSLEALANFTEPSASPCVVKINLLNNDNNVVGQKILCTLPEESSAVFDKNNKKSITVTTDDQGNATVNINNSKVEIVSLHVEMDGNSEIFENILLEWQKYIITIESKKNNSKTDGKEKNNFNAILTNDNIPVSNEDLIFIIPETVTATFTTTRNPSITLKTDNNGAVAVELFDSTMEIFPLVVALAKYPTIHSQIDCQFGSYILTVDVKKNNSQANAKNENSVAVTLTSYGEPVEGADLVFELEASKAAIITENQSKKITLKTDASGVATVFMTSTLTESVNLLISMASSPSIKQNVNLKWNKYSIKQYTASGTSFIIGKDSKGPEVIVYDDTVPAPNVDIVFASPFNTSGKTNNAGRASSSFSASSKKTYTGKVYLKDNPEISTSASVTYNNRYTVTYINYKIVAYGYNMSFLIQDNSGSSASRLGVTATLSGTNDIWFEDLQALTTPKWNTYYTDTGGYLSLPIRFLLAQPLYYRSATLSLKIGSYTVTDSIPTIDNRVT